MKPIRAVRNSFSEGLSHFYNWINFSPHVKRDIVSQFHKLYYDSHIDGKTWVNTKWLGVLLRKCPFDTWVYQEIIYELKPDFIIETGTLFGGSAYFLAHICDLLGNGKILTIDIEDAKETKKRLSNLLPETEKVRPEHPRISYLHGSSTSTEILSQVKKIVAGASNILVILDSDHKKDHVLKEMELYSQFIPIGGYLIVEDSNVNGNPVLTTHGPGPMEAIDEFLRTRKNFVVDESRENHLISFNPRGYLKKVS